RISGLCSQRARAPVRLLHSCSRQNCAGCRGATPSSKSEAAGVATDSNKNSHSLNELPVQRPRPPLISATCTRKALAGETGAFQLGQNFLLFLFQSSMANTDQEQIAIIAEDAEAEAARGGRCRGQTGKIDPGRDRDGGNGAADLRPVAADGRPAGPASAVARPAGRHGQRGRKSSVRMSTQLLLPRQRRAGGGGGGGSGSGRPASPKLDNYLEEVPQPNRPRFSSSMSLEA
uniref:Os01g0772900 protein n=1 Tax=Macrostomum lignano TaxID=282301 RepID=A0A1I8HQ15_9PLAT